MQGTVACSGKIQLKTKLHSIALRYFSEELLQVLGGIVRQQVLVRGPIIRRSRNLQWLKLGHTSQSLCRYESRPNFKFNTFRHRNYDPITCLVNDMMYLATFSARQENVAHRLKTYAISESYF